MTREEIEAARRLVQYHGGHMTRRAADRMAALLAEVDRLRALPVVPTCGACGWADNFCCHPSVPLGRLGERPIVDREAAPPSTCPLRG